MRSRHHPVPMETLGPSYAADIQPIFNQNCIACHSGSQSPDLSDGWSYDELMDGGYVDTDFPCESILYQVFSGTHDGRATEEEVLMNPGMDPGRSKRQLIKIYSYEKIYPIQPPLHASLPSCFQDLYLPRMMKLFIHLLKQ